jgi:HEAT repeat protein
MYCQIDLQDFELGNPEIPVHVRNSSDGHNNSSRKKKRDGTSKVNCKETSVRAAAGEAIVKIIAKPSVPFFITQLENRQARVRLQAATLLGRIGRGAREAIPALEKLRNDSDAGVWLEGKRAIRLIVRSKRGL